MWCISGRRARGPMPTAVNPLRGLDCEGTVVLMRQRTARVGLVLLALAAAGCGGSSPSSAVEPVTAPTAVPQQPIVQSPPASSWLDGFTLSNVALSGLVYEITPTGQIAPLAQLPVYCEKCGRQTHTWAYTDASGVYRFPSDPAQGGGIWLRPGVVTQISVVLRDGYTDPPGLPTLIGTAVNGWREVLITGDTRFDIQLVKR
jgi:hypothetical protein